MASNVSEPYEFSGAIDKSLCRKNDRIRLARKLRFAFPPFFFFLLVRGSSSETLGRRSDDLGECS